MIEDWQNGGFGIYVHWPFCQSKCPYCDFNSHVRQSVDHRQWKTALLSELQHAASLTPNRSVDSIFFGGGTPSLMAPDTVASLINDVAKHWRISNDIEITLEANPTSVEAGKFADFNAAGVNRVSMGIQSLNDTDLKRLGRLHTAAEAMRAFDIAKQYFDRVSFDLIYARQDQSLQAWQSELKSALELAIDHLSLYQLTVESNTAFGALYDQGKLRGLPSDTLAADMYQTTQEICNDFGLSGYEVSNYAKPNAASKHNLVYWRYGDYVGIGPGAHGRVTIDGQKIATTTPSNPEKWLATVNARGTTIEQLEKINKPDQAEEYLMMSMRLSEGTDLERFRELNGVALNQSSISSLTEMNMIIQKDNRIIATTQGRMVLNSVLKELLT